MASQKIISRAAAGLSLLLWFLLLPLLALAQTAAGQTAAPVGAGGLDRALFGLLWLFVNNVFGFFVWVGAQMLDYGINVLVVGFGAIYISWGIGFAVDNLWTFVRDIFNLTFIFGLVYIGFKLIFNSDDSGAKQMLVSLILAALLVNFSLFIAKTVVDFSNILAAQIVLLPNFAGGEELRRPDGSVSVAGAAAAMMGLPSIFQVSTLGVSDPTLPQGAGFMYIFGTMVLYLVAAFVFAAGGILLFVRFVALTIYLVLSPIMFLGWVFPALSGYTSEYWRRFLGQAFMAPAYILMLYFSLYILASARGSVGAAPLSSLFDVAGNDTYSSFAGGMPFFIMTAMLLIASLIVAKKMGSLGADMTISVGHSLRKRGYQMVRGAAGGAARGGAAYSVGMGAEKLLKQPAAKMSQRLLRGGTVSRWAGRSLHSGVDKLGDVGGYRTGKEAREEANRRAGVWGTRIIREQDRKQLLDAGMAAQRKNAAGETLTEAEKENLFKLQQTVTELNTSALEDMADKDLKEIAHLLTQAQTDGYLKSERVGDDQKDALMSARAEALKKVVKEGKEVVSAELTKLSLEQLETLGDEYIRNHAHLLSASQMDELKKSKKFSDVQKTNFESSRSDGFSAFSKATHQKDIRDAFEVKKASGEYVSRKPAEIARLSRDLLLSDYAPFYLNSATLQEIARRGDLSPTDRKRLKETIEELAKHHTDTSKKEIKTLHDGTDYFSTPHAQRNW